MSSARHAREFYDVAAAMTSLTCVLRHGSRTFGHDGLPLAGECFPAPLVALVPCFVA
jgi:hypothetical protein